MRSQSPTHLSTHRVAPLQDRSTKQYAPSHNHNNVTQKMKFDIECHLSPIFRKCESLDKCTLANDDELLVRRQVQCTAQSLVQIHDQLALHTQDRFFASNFVGILSNNSFQDFFVCALNKTKMAGSRLELPLGFLEHCLNKYETFHGGAKMTEARDFLNSLQGGITPPGTPAAQTRGQPAFHRNPHLNPNRAHGNFLNSAGQTPHTVDAHQPQHHPQNVHFHAQPHRAPANTPNTAFRTPGTAATEPAAQLTRRQTGTGRAVRQLNIQ